MRIAVVASAVLAAAALVVGVGSAATPLLTGTKAGPVADSLLSHVAGDGAAGAPASATAAPGPNGTPCVPTVRACVDLAGEQAWLLDGGKIVRGPVPIVTGDDDDPTPKGNFRVQWKAAQWTSRQYLVQMPWSVFFAPGGVAFHEGDPDSPSAGCVKLDGDNAQAFFQFLRVGDPVEVV